MAYNFNILLGRITKISGYEGAVAVKLEKFFFDDIPRLESVFLEIDGRPVPFFVSDYEYNGADILKLSFDGYDSIEKIGEFTGCRVYLTTEKPDSMMVDDFMSLIGYKVLTTEMTIIGTVSEVIQNPGQWLLNVVSPAKKEILIPFHEDFIVTIQKRGKNIIMDIPDGLTEIN